MYQIRKLSVCFYFALLVSINSIAQIGGWESQESNTEAYLNDVFFINTDTGWVVGHGVILNTADGGENWTIQDSADAYFMSVFFTDANQGWAVGFKTSGINSGIIYHTTDGGEHWDLKDSSRFDLNDIIFINPDTGYAVGGIGGNETILKTSDAGTTWEELDVSGGAFFTVQFVNDTVGWAAGDRGCIVKTEDGGSTWTISYVDVGFFPLRSLSFVNPDTGWVVGFDKIYKTTNGGETWESQESQSNHYYYSCFFKNSNSGWVSTSESQSYGKLFFTEDGGNSWVLQKSVENSPLTSIFYLDDSTAWCVGGPGTILKATSGGIVSIREQEPSTDELALGNGLHQNFPNPFSFETTISYKLPVSSQVRLIVYNHQGQEVATLVNRKQSAGKYEINFEGRGLTSGVYFYKLEHAGGISVKKMLLVR